MEGFWTRQRKWGSAFPDAQSSRRNPMQGINEFHVASCSFPLHMKSRLPNLKSPAKPKEGLSAIGFRQGSTLAFPLDGHVKEDDRQYPMPGINYFLTITYC
jgi:hypothetical protein